MRFLPQEAISTTDGDDERRQELTATSTSFPPRFGFSIWISRSVYNFRSEDDNVLKDLLFNERNRIGAMPAHFRSYGVDCLVPGPITSWLRYQNLDGSVFGDTHCSVPRLFSNHD